MDLSKLNWSPDTVIDGWVRDSAVRVCEVCGGHTRGDLFTVRHRERGAVIYVYQINAEVCDSCGARFMRPTLTKSELEQRILKGELKPENK